MYVCQYPVLSTAILSVASKFFRKDLYPSLLSHAEVLVQRAMATGEPSLPLIKALLILVFWKPPSDKTAWLKTGIAMRLGYQLGLNRQGETRPSEVVSAKHDERDRQRTWFCEFHSQGIHV